MFLAEVPCKPNEREMERIMAQYGSRLIKMCYLCLRDVHAAEDAAQETFLKAYKHWGGFRGDCSEKTWLMRIAVNTCRDMRRTAWFRRVDRRVTIEDMRETGEERVDADPTVAQAVMNLPAKYREVVLLYYYQEMNTSDIAQSLRVPINTVKSRLLRAKTKLREALKEWYVDDGQ